MSGFDCKGAARGVTPDLSVCPRVRPVTTGLAGSGLTEGMDEEALTTGTLWEVVTGKPGTRGWAETVRVVCRSDESEAARKAEDNRSYGPARAGGHVHDVLRPPVHYRPPVDHSHPAVLGAAEADLRRGRDVVAVRGEGAADETLVVAQPVRLGRVEKGHPQLHGAPTLRGSPARRSVHTAFSTGPAGSRGTRAGFLRLVLPVRDTDRAAARQLIDGYFRVSTSQ